MAQAEGLAYYIPSHPAHSLRRLTSVTKKNILFFFPVFLAPKVASNTGRSFVSSPISFVFCKWLRRRDLPTTFPRIQLTHCVGSPQSLRKTSCFSSQYSLLLKSQATQVVLSFQVLQPLPI